MICVCVGVGGLVSPSLTSLNNSVSVFLSTLLTYIVIFPQVVCVLFNISNSYGAVMGWLLGLLLCGEPLIGLLPILHLPGCTLEDGVYIQHSPVNTISMLAVFAAILLFSYLFSLLIHKGMLPEKWNMLNMKAQ